MVRQKRLFEIKVNNDYLEFEDSSSVNLRINNTLFNPESISTTQSEYSFTFSVPFTPKNNSMFGFASTPSVRGKFVRQFACEVYCDGIVIFSGLLRLSSIEKGSYSCNLISVKNSTVDDIFGEDTMDKIKWYVDYKPTNSQNEANEEQNPDWFYPLVCYGAFQKNPYMTIKGEDSELSYYSSTNVLDKYTRYYAETFIPTPKLIEVIKRMIEQKGYTWSGDVFEDDLINKVYISSKIGNEQVPAYNYNSPLGRQIVKFKYDVKGSKTVSVARNTNNAIERTLTYPEDYHYLLSQTEKDSNMGDDMGLIFSLFNKPTSIEYSNQYMWQDQYIVIPHSGYYKIRMDLDVQLTSTDTTVEDSYPSRVSIDKAKTLTLIHEPYTRQMDLDKLQYDIQLVKNDSTELEFISTNKINYQMNPTSDTRSINYYSDYPHELYYQNGTIWRSGNRSVYADIEYYYQPKGNTRSYDPSVNSDFIMGMSTVANSWSYIKRGKSWDKEIPDFGYNNYKCYGYARYNESNGVGQHTASTDYQSWQDTDVPVSEYTKLSTRQHNGKGYAIVWLEKNDMLSLKLLTKEYKTYADKADDGQQTITIPSATIQGSISIEAFSPKKSDLKKSFYSESSFDKKLNLGNFLSNEETQKDFFNNFLTTFNLNCNINGKNIEITLNKGTDNLNNGTVDVDDRINVSEATMGVVDFPNAVDIQFTINTEESGFYHSVPSDKINDDDWEKYGDYGYKKIEIFDNPFSTNTISKTSKFSRNWMMDFQMTDWYERDNDSWNHIDNGNSTVSLPIIARDEYFIDGGDYEEMMQHDGRSLSQRMFFKGELLDKYVPNRNYAVYDDNGNLKSCDEYLRICLATPYYKGEDVLKYTNEEHTLLSRYFNVVETVEGNYVTIEVYLTPKEYMMIKHGATVRFDNDRHVVCSITGFDPSGNNKTKIKMLKL